MITGYRGYVKIGNGDIAAVLPDRDDLLFFASGVSNSKEERESEYEREIDLLLEQPRDAHLVYFSSLAVFSADTRYIQHKRSMETMVKINFPKYTIVRIGNIDWGDNPHTIINFFRNQLMSGNKVVIKDEYRYIVNRDEFLYWLNLIPDFSCEMNIPGRRLKVGELYDEYLTAYYAEI